MCIDIKELCYGIAKGQISSIFYSLPENAHIFVSGR